MHAKPSAWFTDRSGAVRVAFVGKFVLQTAVDHSTAASDIPGKSDAEAALVAVSRHSPKGMGVVVNRQVHSDVVIDAAEAPAEADGLFSEAGPAPSRALGVFTADCVPVLIGNPATGSVAALHAGWRGLASKIISRGCSRFEQEASPSQLTAWIGPSIGACCYRVSEEVAIQVAEPSGAGAVVNRPSAAAREERRPHLNLVQAAEVQLRRAGLEDIRRIGPCTRCDERWHSYRRSGAGSGRNYGLIWSSD